MSRKSAEQTTKPGLTVAEALDFLLNKDDVDLYDKSKVGDIFVDNFKFGIGHAQYRHDSIQHELEDGREITVERKAVTKFVLGRTLKPKITVKVDVHYGEHNPAMFGDDPRRYIHEGYSFNPDGTLDWSAMHLEGIQRKPIGGSGLRPGVDDCDFEIARARQFIEDLANTNVPLAEVVPIFGTKDA